MHAKYPLAGSGISEILDLSLAIPATEAFMAIRHRSCNYGLVLNLVATCYTAVGAVVA